jgi:hypothetical protein
MDLRRDLTAVRVIPPQRSLSHVAPSRVDPYHGPTTG